MPEFDIRTFMQGLKSLDDKEAPEYGEECWHQLFAQATYHEQVEWLMGCAFKNGRERSPRVIRTVLAVARAYHDHEIAYEEVSAASGAVRGARHGLEYLFRASDTEQIGQALIACREAQDLGLLRELIGYVHRQLPTEDDEPFAHQYLWGDGDLAQNFLEQCFCNRSMSAGGQGEWLYENLTLCMDELIALWVKTEVFLRIWPGPNRAEPYAEGNESYPRRHRAVVAALTRFVSADPGHQRSRAADELKLYYLERRQYLRAKEHELSRPDYPIAGRGKQNKQLLEEVRQELAALPEL